MSELVRMAEENTAEEMQRVMLWALLGWDEFPSDTELRDVHTKSLLCAHLQDQPQSFEESGETLGSTINITLSSLSARKHALFWLYLVPAGTDSSIPDTSEQNLCHVGTVDEH